MGYRGYAEANGFIVAQDNTGDFTTIQAAVTAATAPITIFIKPGLYIEDVVMKPVVNLVAWETDAYSGTVSIKGKISYSGTGIVALSGLTLLTNGDYAVEVTGAVQSQLFLINCSIFVIDHAAIHFTSSVITSFLQLNNCSGDFAADFAFFVVASAGNFVINDSDFSNVFFGSTPSTCGSTGPMQFSNVELHFPIVYTSSSIFSSLSYCDLDVSYAPGIIGLTTTGTGSFSLVNTSINSNAATCLTIGAGTTVSATECTLFTSAANAITGAGTLKYGVLIFTGSSHGITTTTQVPYFVKVGNVFLSASQQSKVTTPGGYPYTIVPDQDYYILADSSGGAVTVKLPATPLSGDTYVVKDASGTSLANPITVDGNGNNIDGGPTFLIDSNYAAYTFIFNGTIWNIF